MSVTGNLVNGASFGRFVIVAVGLVIGGSGLSPASAQQPDASLPTAMPDVRTYAAMPQGFDPATASPGEIARYGLPPRPDATSDPEGYAAWLEDVGPGIERPVPKLRRSSTVYAGAKKLSDTNWSGIVFQTDVSRYGKRSFQSVHAAWTVPSVQPPLGTCRKTPNSGTFEVGIWPGIGGFGGEPALLQAGMGAATACADGAVEARYWAWYEFYPKGSVVIETLPVSPGDAMSVYVWSTSGRKGHAYLVNRSLKKSASFAFTAPKGTPLVGSSVEWIVERPGHDGVLSDLANYTEVTIHQATAKTGTGLAVASGGSYTGDGITKYNVTMTTSTGRKKKLSVASTTGPSAIRFEAVGPGRTGE